MKNETEEKVAEGWKPGLPHLTGPTGRKVKIPPVEVAFNTVLTSSHSQANSTIIKDNTLSHNQVVVAAGANSTYQVGDWVMVDVDKFPKDRRPGQHDMGDIVTIVPPIRKIGDTDYLKMTDREIDWKYLDKSENIAE